MVENVAQANEWLFGWDETPGIVSCWADRSGRALVWRRVGGQVVCERVRYWPWVFARNLDDSVSLRDVQCISYRRLTEGRAGDYRYIISAPNFRVLERAILPGAARRLRMPLCHLTELEDYHSLGPIEQYLIATGRTYFKGMAYNDLHRLQFDLSVTALDPAVGHIFMVAIKDSNGLETLLEATTAADEAQLIHDLCALIQERDPDVIEGYGIFGLDLPFLAERARRLGIPLTLGRLEGKRGELQRDDVAASHYHRAQVRYTVAGREIIDVLQAVWRHDAGSRNMGSYHLQAAAHYFGITNTIGTPIHGHNIHDRFAARPTKVRRYALDNVRAVDGLSQVLMGAAFAIAGMAPRPYSRAANAGPAMGILEPMLVRAYYRAGAALPRSADLSNPELRRSKGGASYLLAGGLARHVVKCDVASMYPSIMTLHNIGPQYDHLGVLVQLVGRLMELRLGYKAAGRVATTGSPAANQYKALSAGMKLLIVSAYGYMAAGGMALLADVDAADALTARSREILDQVIAELRSRGMALLEADVDGVYFAVPEGWREDEERALVAEVGATLPVGIKLEFEGHYAAMYSNEIKNYALLGYDGKMIVHGSGLRSSSSPPFAARFLEDALEHLLRGDIIAVVGLYQATVAMLRSRKFTLNDVATRTRLTKSVSDYQRSRSRLKEGSYEALLAAGRSHWEVGERVRFYHAQGGRYVWLPYEPDDLDDSISGAEGSSGMGVSAGEERRDYDVKYYLRLLRESYLGRLKKAFREEDFKRLFREKPQPGLWERYVTTAHADWIEAPGVH
jgi:DNA polymerase, archaea type